MSETANADGEPLTPEQAASTIERARGYEAPLRRRTEGVTWMIWGLVTTGIALSYGVVSDYFPGYEPTPWWIFAIIMLAWPLAGVLMTFATWRIAALNLPSSEDRSLRSALSGALWLPLVYAGIGGVFVVGIATEAAAIPIGIGIAWLTLGALNPFQATRTGRRALIVIGGITLAGALGFAPFASSFPHQGYPAMRALTAVLGGGVPFLVGLWQTLRG